MERERTLFLVKPDAVQRGLAGEIIKRLESRGLKLVGLKLMQVTLPIAEKHYAEHKGKPFFEGLVQFITSAPVVAAVLEGTNAIEIVRATNGLTNPLKAAPGTIRADFGLEMGRNLVHASDSPTSAAREIKIFFKASELVDWTRDSDRWIYE
ncbi:MAG: nucleoside-diphosphate kinase [Dehalococcoidia bacterium]|nr:nucleoside-diphosphate kinase [Dehalococcoidia bacterium]